MPRSGSTLLGSLLAQHTDVYVSSTSPLNRIMHGLYQTLQDNAPRGIWDIDAVNSRIFKYMFEGWYEPIKQKYIFDKSRGWGFNIQAVKAFIQENPKVLITYRDIPSIITSFIVLIEQDPKNHVDIELYKRNKPINTETRAEYIWECFKDYGYLSTLTAMQEFQDDIHIVHYDSLVSNPAQTMKDVWNFLEIEAPEHTFTEVQTYLEVPDEKWGIENLHVIRPNIEKISKNPMEVLGQELYEKYSEYNLI